MALFCSPLLSSHLNKNLAVRPPGIELLQLVLMVQIALVVKVLGALGALLHAGTALDALPHHTGHVVGVDGCHGAETGTQAAHGP